MVRDTVDYEELMQAVRRNSIAFRDEILEEAAERVDQLAEEYPLTGIAWAVAARAIRELKTKE